MPCTATRSPARAPELRRALKTVMPAQSRGAASAAGEIVGDGGDRFGGGDHVFGIAAVVADAGDLLILQLMKSPRRQASQVKAVAAVPADADALAGLPVGDVSADGVDAAGDFVSGDAGILDAGPMAFFDQRIAMADAAGFDLNSDLVAAGFGDVSFDQFEIAAGFADLDSFHF